MSTYIKNITTALIFHLLTVSHSQAMVTFGDPTDNDCDFIDFQSALDSGENEIRLANQLPVAGNFEITHDSLLLHGGYDNCSDAAQNIHDNVSQSHFISSDIGHIFEVTDNDHQITFKNLNISDTSNGSGIKISGENGSTEIIGSDIHHNASTTGAGVAVVGFGSELLVIDSVISDNQATFSGGGLYCLDATIKINAHTLVSNNQVFGGGNTFGKGGGLHATDCNLEIYAGHIDLVSAGFINNQATVDGGAIYANNSQLLINGQQETAEAGILGDLSHPALFKDNISDSDGDGFGAGAALNLKASSATIQGVWVDNNKPVSSNYTQSNRGAALYAHFGSVVTITRDDNQNCWRQGMCNLITNNEHVPIYVQRPPTQVTINNTEFYGNETHQTAMIWIHNSTGFDSGDGPFFTFENNLVHNNVSSNVGLFKTDSSSDHCCHIELNINYNTITNNQFVSEIVDINDDVTLNMHGNIIYEPVGMNPVFDILNSTFNEAHISCLLAHEISSVPNIIASTFIGNPQFVDMANNDYHLTEISDAIDVCDTSQITPNHLDIDQQIRGIDQSNQQEIDGFYDLGIDEYHQPDLIFDTGFE